MVRQPRLVRQIADFAQFQKIRRLRRLEFLMPKVAFRSAWCPIDVSAKLTDPTPVPAGRLSAPHLQACQAPNGTKRRLASAYAA